WTIQTVSSRPLWQYCVFTSSRGPRPPPWKIRLNASDAGARLAF
ncbi:hypothetical protein, partial [Pseudomonas sp. FEN]